MDSMLKGFGIWWIRMFETAIGWLQCRKAFNWLTDAVRAAVVVLRFHMPIYAFDIGHRKAPIQVRQGARINTKRTRALADGQES